MKRQNSVPLVCLVLFLLLSCSVQASSCPKVSPDGFYTPNPNNFHTGVPPPYSILWSFAQKPSWLSECQLNSLHSQCLTILNNFRTGAQGFATESNPNIPNPNVGPLPQFTEAAKMNKCWSESALGDYAAMQPYCSSGAHLNAGSCTGLYNGYAQNMCCPRPVSSFADVQTQMYGCLQQMYNEGMDSSTDQGHYITMVNPTYLYASCGFSFSVSYSGAWSVVMTQNFGGAYNSAAATVNTLAPTPPTSASPTATPTTRAPTSLRPTMKPTPSSSPTVIPSASPTVFVTTVKSKKKKHKGLLI